MPDSSQCDGDCNRMDLEAELPLANSNLKTIARDPISDPQVAPTLSSSLKDDGAANPEMALTL